MTILALGSIEWQQGWPEPGAHLPPDVEIVWVQVSTAEQTAQGRDILPLETHFHVVWRWKGEGWAHVQMSASPGPREEDTSASRQPTADACPSNTCSSFLTGPGGSVARREQGTGGTASGYSEGICAALTHHPRAIWCPSRKGVGCGTVAIVWSPSPLHTTHPGEVPCQRGPGGGAQ